MFKSGARRQQRQQNVFVKLVSEARLDWKSVPSPPSSPLLSCMQYPFKFKLKFIANFERLNLAG